MSFILYMPDGVPFTAMQERQARSPLLGGGSANALGGRSGFRVGTPTDVLTVTTTAYTLKPCSAMIDPGVNTGMYGWVNTANYTGAPTPPDDTLPRKDLYYIQISDSTAGDGSGTVNADLKYLAGTPNANPQAPALPVRSFEVATATVPQVGGGNPTVVINPARFVAAGAPLPISSQTAEDALTKYLGSEIIRTDLPGMPRRICNGTAWVPTAEAQGLKHHEAVTANSGFINLLTVIKHIPSFDFKAGRRYRIGWDFKYQGNTAGNYVTALIGTCLPTDDPGITAGITQRAGRPFKIHDGNVDSSGRVTAIYKPTSDLTRQVKFLLQVTTGAGLARISAAALEPVDYTIEDLGAQ